MGSFFSSLTYFFSSLINPNPANNGGASDGSSSVIHIRSKSSWDEHWNANKQDSNKLMLIDFSASWCGPCRFIAPVFEAFAAKYTAIVFVKIDTDELPEVARQWKVQGMPTFVLVKGGEDVGRVVGAKKDELEAMIKRSLRI